jgi:hypothetical protein
MNSKIEHLSKDEKQLIHDAPLLIATLIAGADGEFDHAEINRAVKIIHIKTFSEGRDVRGVYKDIDAHSSEKIDELIQTLPAISHERTAQLKEKLTGLNQIFPKLDDQFAVDLYTSLRELAYYVSHENDGGVGIKYNSEQDKYLVHLKFLNKPV